MALASTGHVALALAAGALTTLSPCVFPVLPLVVGGALQRHRWGPVAMATGMTLSFTVMGVLLGAASPAWGIEPDAVRSLGGALLLFLGVVMLVPFLGQRFARWMGPLASRANHAAHGLNGNSLAGSMLLGALLGLVWSPCSGPLLAAALTLVATEGGAWRGALILGAFGAGAATVLMLAAYASRAGFSRTRGWVLGHAHTLNHAFGLVLLLFGSAIVLGWDKQFEALVVPLLPDSWVALTVGI